MPEHGGNLREAAQRYDIDLEDWLDLSTGINPYAYPVPALSPQAWQRLPQADDGLNEAACDYYQAPGVLPVAGSQQAIQLLPELRPSSRVGVLTPSYNEHAYRWQLAGHQVMALEPASIEAELDQLDVLLVVNPNNPTGHRFTREQLLAWHQVLSGRGGWLVVDEAFIDCTPDQSLAACSDRPGLIVLRSIGKFFGLPGLRGGFVLAEPALLTALQERIGPWAVAGPAREMMRRVLQDSAWQQKMRDTLPWASRRLAGLLAEYGLTVDGSTALFVWFRTRHNDGVHAQLARRGIWSRRFPASHTGEASLRLGLPGAEREWRRLQQALADFLVAPRKAVSR